MNNYNVFLTILFFILFTCISVLLIIYYNIDKKNKKNKREDKKLKDINPEYLKIEPDKLLMEIDKLIERNLEQYTFNEKFMNKDAYLSGEELDEISKELSKITILNLSDMYLDYIRLLTYIPDTEPRESEQLIRFIFTRVNYKVLDFAKEFNNKEG